MAMKAMKAAKAVAPPKATKAKRAKAMKAAQTAAAPKTNKAQMKAMKAKNADKYDHTTWSYVNVTNKPSLWIRTDHNKTKGPSHDLQGVGRHGVHQVRWRAWLGINF